MPDFKMTAVDGKQVLATSNSILDDDINSLLAISSDNEKNIISQIDPCWAGAAKEAFVRDFIQYTSGLTKLLDGYRELAEQLRKAGENYDKADEMVRQLITKLQR